ncbi:hypothetical protein H9P43_003806 [Blastocladiella emersonii ATCC 22665]|nr:hypothetical protein H9P43_003806 [Blastocladiella emersonii ATCC 22665]
MLAGSNSWISHSKRHGSASIVSGLCSRRLALPRPITTNHAIDPLDTRDLVQPPAPPPLDLHVTHVDAHPPDAATGPRRLVTSTPSTSTSSTSSCNGSREVRGDASALILNKVATRAPSTPSSGKWADPHLRRQLAHNAPKPASLGQRQQNSTTIKNTLRGLAARVVAGLKHALGCACEFQFEVIKYTTLQRQGSIYHGKLLRRSPTDRSALPSSPHSAAYSFMVK